MHSEQFKWTVQKIQTVNCKRISTKTHEEIKCSRVISKR